MTAPGVPFATAFAVACLGIALYSGMDVTMKALTLQSGVFQAMLWRSGVGTLLGGAARRGLPGGRAGRGARRCGCTSCAACW